MHKIENQIHHQKIIDKINELIEGYNEMKRGLEEHIRKEKHDYKEMNIVG